MKRRALWRALRVIAIIALFAGLAYPAASNLFLALGGVELMFESTETVKVEFRKAWSFWPGVVHVEGLRVRMQDRNVQFVLTMARADVDIRLSELARRTFHATRVRGEGLTFRFRHRIEPESASAPFVTALPPVTGFDDPPLREAGPPEPPLDEAHYNLWTIHIEDVDVGITELWAQMVRYQGDARARGAFRLRPAKRLWVGPAELVLRGGSASVGPHDLLRDLEGTLTCKVDDFDVEPSYGMGVFRFVSAHALLSSAVTSLDAVGFLSPSVRSLGVEDGGGLLDVDAAVDHGVVTRDSHARYRARHLAVKGRDARFSLDGDLSVDARGASDGAGTRATLTILGGRLRPEASPHPPLTIGRALAAVDTTFADVTAESALKGGRLEVHDVVARDLRTLNDLPRRERRPWRVEGGRGALDGSLAMAANGALSGGVDARLDRAEASAGTLHVRATIDSRAELRADASREASGRGHARGGPLEIWDDSGAATEARTFTVATDVARDRAGVWSGEIDAQSDAWVGKIGSARVAASSISGAARFAPRTLTGNVRARDVRASVAGACPWFEIDTASIDGKLDSPAGLPPSARVRAALEGALFRWGQFVATAERTTVAASGDAAAMISRLDATGLRFENEGGAPRSWQALAGTASITTELDLAGNKVEGPVRVEIGAVDGQVGETRVTGDIAASLAMSSRDPAHRVADVSGIVRTRRVAIFAGDRRIDQWWADVYLDRAHLDTSENFDLSGQVRARFRDGLPALNILASKDEIPGWVPGLLPLSGLSLDLDVHRRCRFTDVRVARASGGPLEAEGRLQVKPGDTRGAILLKLASFNPVAVGLAFDEDDSGVSPLVGQGWLAERSAPLAAVASVKREEACPPDPPQCDERDTQRASAPPSAAHPTSGLPPSLSRRSPSGVEDPTSVPISRGLDARESAGR